MESKNLAFYSTNVVKEKGRGEVIKTGDDTVMGLGINWSLKMVSMPLLLSRKLTLVLPWG